MSMFAVRTAAATDVPALLDLIHSAYRGERSRAGWTGEAHLLDGTRTDEATLRAELDDPATTFLVVEDAEGLLACCAVTDRGGGSAYFGTFAVRPPAQGSGVGGRLLVAAEQHARTAGATRMELTVLAQRPELIAWYVRRGYAETGELRAFPYGDERYGRPRRPDLVFSVLSRPLGPGALVILGATGDLTGRYLLPALAELLGAGLLPDGMRIRGVGRARRSEAEFRRWAGAELAEHAPAVATEVRKDLLARCDYRTAEIAAGSAGHAESVTTADAGLAGALQGLVAPVCYLALPADVFTPTARALSRVGLPAGSRVAVEKPYGTGTADSADLTEVLDRLVGADSVFRVDHFLAEPAAHHLLALRFTNRMVEPMWNAGHVETVELVWDETLTLEGRASYYDRAGALRDVIANHLLALMSLVAMERPVGRGAADLHRARLELLRAVRTPTTREIATTTRRARYTAGEIGDRVVPDYTDEPGVDATRGTETLAEVALQVDNPRWAGTVFHLRSGKALARARAEITLRLRPTDSDAFTGDASANVLRLQMQPPRLILQVNGNPTGDGDGDGGSALPPGHPVVLSADLPSGGLSPYAQVLHAIVTGNQRLSVQAAEVAESWRIMEPILASWADGVPPLQPYPAGSSGPGPARPEDGTGARTLVICGVSGIGKSAIGSAVAARLGWLFADADDFHPAANVAKMATGAALTEHDRAGWLTELADWIGCQERGGRSSVLACSALRRAHRDVLRRGNSSVLFVHLHASPATMLGRMQRRSEHFMPASQLDDQLATWEALCPDEPGFSLDAAAPAHTVVEHLLDAVASPIGDAHTAPI